MRAFICFAALVACSSQAASPKFDVGTTALAVDGETVFAVASVDKEHAKLVTCPASDCSAPREVAAFEGRSSAIAVDADAVYAVVTWGLHWHDGHPDTRAARSQVLSIGRAGGVDPLLDAPIAEGEVIRVLPDGDYLYLTIDVPQGTIIARANLRSRSGIERLATVPDQSPFALAVDAQNVYWTAARRSDNAGSVLRVAKAGGEPVELARTPRMARGLARNGDTLYVTTFEVPTRGKQGAVLAVPVAGGEPRVVLGNTDVAPSIAIAGLDAYVFVEPTRDSWQLTKLPLDGGAATVIATGTDSAMGIALAPGRVVFAHDDFETGRGGIGVRPR